MTLTAQQFVVIPVTNEEPCYVMKVSLDGTIYQLRFYFNDRMGFWFMDILDQSGNEVLSELPMFTDYPLNWREAQRIPGTPPGIFYVIDETGQNNLPTRDNFGADVKLYYLQAGG